jgi:hypothetical protein
MMQNHLFIGTDGGLYNTRLPGWYEKPLRAKYSYTHATIDTVQELKATLRNGQYTFPGGYLLVFGTSDGACLCFDCVRSEFANVADSIARGIHDGWKVDSCFIADHMESDLYCDHCNAKLNEMEF